MGREPSFETIEIRGPHSQPACPHGYIDLQFVDVEKQLFEGLNPADCFLDGKQALGQLLMNHKSKAGYVDFSHMRVLLLILY